MTCMMVGSLKNTGLKNLLVQTSYNRPGAELVVPVTGMHSEVAALIALTSCARGMY